MYDLVFTGEAPFGNRDQWKAAAEQELGAKVRPSICSKTNTVVFSTDAADKPTRKFNLGERQGCRLLTYNRFLKEMGLHPSFFKGKA
jgi:NAD-dependent DNA ligase